MVTVLEAYKAVLEQGKNARGVTFETKEEQMCIRDSLEIEKCARTKTQRDRL